MSEESQNIQQPTENSSKLPIRQQPCSICRINMSKYNCPQCERKTCSLDCFKRHKQRMNCEGKSDLSLNKTTYIVRDDLSSAHVQRDYNLLTKLGRSLELGKREAKTNRINTRKRPFQGEGANKRRNFDDDSNVILKRGVRIKLVPDGMSRKHQNKSMFDNRKNKFMWTLEWLLVDSKFSVLNKYISFKNAEDSTLSELVPFRRFSRALEQPDATDEDANEQLKSQFNYFLVAESDKNEIVKIPGETKLSEALLNRLFIEFPTLFVSVETEFEGKRVVEFEEESDSESESESDSDSESESDSDSSDDEPPEEESAKKEEPTEPTEPTEPAQPEDPTEPAQSAPPEQPINA